VLFADRRPQTMQRAKQAARTDENI